MKPFLLFCLLIWAAVCVCQPNKNEGIIYKVDSLNKAAEAFGNAGKIEEGLATAKSAAELALQNLGAKHELYAASLSALGVLFYQAGRYPEAEPLFRQAKDIYEATLGKESNGYATNTDNLGEMCRLAGRYAEAEPLFIEALNLRRKILGENHFDFAVSQNNLANLYYNTARFEEAEPLFVQSKDLLVKLLGEENLNSALIISNLATFYENLGRYEEAEPLLLKSNAVLEKLIGEHYIFATNLNNLASLYNRTGRLNQAEKLYLRAKSIREKTIGKAHRDYYFQTLNNMADLYRLTKRYTEAESFFLEALELARQNGDAAHPDYATTLNNLANLYQEVGCLEDAEKTYRDGCATMKEALGTTHPHYAICLSNLSNFLGNTGRADIGLPLCQEALAILDKTLGKRNSHYLACLQNLALLHQILGQNKAAEDARLEANTTQRSLLAASARYLSEREKASYVSLFLADLDNFLSFVQATNSGSSSALIGAAYDNALFHKGFLLSASIKMRQLVGANPKSERDFLLLLSYHRRLAALYSLPIAERDSASIAGLEEKANDLEKGLVRTVAGYGEAIRQVNWQEVQQQLKQGEAALEFVDYHYYNPNATDSIMYAALLLKPGEAAPRVVTLFEEQNIASLVKGASGKAIGKINALYTGEDAKTLYDLVWKPLEPFLADVKTLYVSPSGLLYRLNLGAISTNNGSPISDQYRIITLGSTRGLVLPDTLSRTGTDAVLVGGVRFTTDTTAIAATNANIAPKGWPTKLPFHSDTRTRGGKWTYLPETTLEVQEIHNLLQSARWTATLDTGYKATEETFRSIGQGNPSPLILHVATHGFFYPDPKENPQSTIGNPQPDAPVFKLSEHPMIRSGLLLAGADEAWASGKAPQNREDGILTAYEISQMNLSNTELVVLSACETGLGEIEGNEGVYGLQRAFKIAGAKYLIMSLWEVSDKSTRELMTDFYRQWLVKGLDIPEAFRTAQNNMRKKYPTAPYLWAGFVLVE